MQCFAAISPDMARPDANTPTPFINSAALTMAANVPARDKRMSCTLATIRVRILIVAYMVFPSKWNSISQLETILRQKRPCAPFIYRFI